MTVRLLNRRSAPRCRNPMWLVAALLAAGPVHANPITDENARPGSTAWQMTAPITQGRCVATACLLGVLCSPEIEGYASRTSVAPGETLRVFVNTPEPTYSIRIFRLGWYGGLGGREVRDSTIRNGVVQVVPAADSTTGRIECHWIDPFPLVIGSDWVSGMYVALLTAGVSGRQAYVPFVVRDDVRPSALLFQTSVTTYQAYNPWGGGSLYDFNSLHFHRAREVSFDRPYCQGYGAGEMFFWEVNMARWLEREGYDVSYATDVDTHASLDRLLSHRAILCVGHDEYWTSGMRHHLETARARGIGLGFFGADDGFWQIRLAPDATGGPDRTEVCYKQDAIATDPLMLDGDPTNDSLVTAAWRNRPVYRPEDELVGEMMDDAYDNTGLQVRVGDNDLVVSDPNHWMCAGTGLQAGDHLPGLLGSEVDRVYGNAPATISVMAHSPFRGYDATADSLVLIGYADVGTYIGAGGAPVFDAGTFQWTWGLDDFVGTLAHPVYTDPRVQQMTRNVIAALMDRRGGSGGSPVAGASLDVYPNPGRPSAVAFRLDTPSMVDLSVFDLQGRRLATLTHTGYAAGSHVVPWGSVPASGAKLPPGVYFCRLRTDHDAVNRTLVLTH